jgi:hypothetical protein
MSEIIPAAPVGHHIVTMDEVEEKLGYRPGVGIVPKPKEIHEFIVHEEHMKHDNQFIQTVGKSIEAIEKEKQSWIAKGYREVGADAFRIQMQTIPRKPIGYCHEYKRLDKVLRQYREGVKVEDADSGMMIEISPPHYRTWGGPGFLDIGGQVHKEPMTRETFQKHWEATGRFSKLVWVDDWEEFRKIM